MKVIPAMRCHSFESSSSTWLNSPAAPHRVRPQTMGSMSQMPELRCDWRTPRMNLPLLL